MKKILFLSATVLMLASCDLDINENPNYPSNGDVTADLVFPAIENSIATAVGDQMFNYAGFFAQYWDQMPTANQYNDLAELNIDEGSDLFNRCYSNLYAQALQDVEDVRVSVSGREISYSCEVRTGEGKADVVFSALY